MQRGLNLLSKKDYEIRNKSLWEYVTVYRNTYLEEFDYEKDVNFIF